MGTVNTSRQNHPSRSSAEPLVVDDGDLDLAHEVLVGFELTQGRYRTWNAITAIARAGDPWLGGAPTDEAFARRLAEGAEGADVHRTWRWLAAVSREAYRCGDGALVNRVALFCWFWVTRVAPSMLPCDEAAARIPRTPPEPVLAEVYGNALRVLPDLDYGRVVTAGSEQFCCTVVELLHGCLGEAGKHRALLAPDVVAILDGHSHRVNAEVARRATVAPQLPAGFFEDMLREAGFPVTENNLLVLCERFGLAVLREAYHMVDELGGDWEFFEARYGDPHDDLPRWPQRLLDAIATLADDTTFYLWKTAPGGRPLYQQMRTLLLEGMLPFSPQAPVFP